MNKKIVHIYITGKVQGVSYRWWFQKEGIKNNLSGWVRNRTSNRVEAEVSGNEENIDILIEKCKVGPPLADVENVIVKEIKELTLVKSNSKDVIIRFYTLNTQIYIAFNFNYSSFTVFINQLHCYFNKLKILTTTVYIIIFGILLS